MKLRLDSCFTAFVCVLISLCAGEAWAEPHTRAQAETRPLKLTAWNLEHLADTDNEGCKPRAPKDYERLKRIAAKLDADIVAVQEVENENALARVFDPEKWRFEISTRPDESPAPECWHRPGASLITQRTGFAIRKPLRYTRNPDLKSLDVGGNNGDRYGVDITLEAGAPLRLLSVHLKSGCHTRPATSLKTDCRILFAQQRALKAWVEARAEDEIPFALLGDFNRRLQRRGDFWTALDAPDDPHADLSLPITADAVSPCIERYKDFVDLIVFNPQSRAFLKPDSFHVHTYEGDEIDFPSDHCPVSVELVIPDLQDAKPQADTITRALKWVRRSAEFPLIAAYMFSQAMTRVDEIAEMENNASDRIASDWVVSVDLDETVLDNSLGQLENEYLGLGFKLDRWARWEQRGAAEAIPGAIAFMNHVLARGGRIAAITNRNANAEAATLKNLIDLGLDYDPRTVCILGRIDRDRQEHNAEEWETHNYKNDKDRRRRLIREGKAATCWTNDPDGTVKAAWNLPLRFVLWLADNVKDLPGVTQRSARLHGTAPLEFGKDYFILPNPLYGSWTNNKPLLPKP